MSTIDYYNTNAKQYYDDTVNADMSVQYAMFEKYLQQNAKILDLGCGSGRDSLYFISKGYKVTALDGSQELCKLAEQNIQQDVICKNFKDIDYDNEFDAIWACSSLLHLNKEDLLQVLKKLEYALVKDGCIYASFKLGNFEGNINGRYYLYQTEQSLKELISNTSLKILESTISKSVLQDREEWLNLILKK